MAKDDSRSSRSRALSILGKKAPHTRSRDWASSGIPRRMLMATGHYVLVLSPSGRSIFVRG